MRRSMTATLVLAMSGLAATARADGPGGDACAANLAPDGKAIYAVTVAAKPTLETLRSVVERETRSLAMADKIGRGDARENAVAAGECMRLPAVTAAFRIAACQRFANSGSRWAVTAGAGPSKRSISTRQVWAMQPWLSFEAPMSSVSTLGLPCFSSGRLEPASAGSNQAPVDSRTTPRRMRSLTAAPRPGRRRGR